MPTYKYLMLAYLFTQTFMFSFHCGWEDCLLGLGPTDKLKQLLNTHGMACTIYILSNVVREMFSTFFFNSSIYTDIQGNMHLDKFNMCRIKVVLLSYKDKTFFVLHVIYM